MKSESDWHHEKVHSLRQRVETTEGLNIRKYSVAPEVCDHIKAVSDKSCPASLFSLELLDISLITQ